MYSSRSKLVNQPSDLHSSGGAVRGLWVRSVVSTESASASPFPIKYRQLIDFLEIRIEAFLSPPKIFPTLSKQSYRIVNTR